MGTTFLRQLLRDFCCNLPWNYAVFWKLQNRGQMLLTWEDACFNNPRLREPMESISDNCCFNETNETISFGCEESTCNIDAGYGIKSALANMSCLHYALGEGVIGKVASMEKHCWVFADEFYTGEFNSELVHECPDEWLLQFAAGIKTILLVPVVPHGVLQLGSLETIADDPAKVANIMNMFNTLQYVTEDTLSLTSSKELTTSHPASVSSSLLENLIGKSAITYNQLHPVQTEGMTLHGVQIEKDKLSILAPQFYPSIQESVSTVEIEALSAGPTVLSFPQKSTDDNHFEMMGDNPFTFSHCNDTKEFFAGQSHMNMNLYSATDIKDILFRDQTDYAILDEFFRFPVDSELHRALGPTFQKNCSENLWDPVVRSSPIRHRDLCDGFEPSVGESHDWFSKGGDEEYLLDAMVANVSNALSGEFSASCLTQTRAETSFLMREDLIPRTDVRSMFVDNGRNFVSNFSTEASLLINDVKKKKSFVGIGPNRDAKLSRVCKRRAKASDVQRRRPRDRQMIQDRVKELRGLVPNGAKCSIDALLDRTIKHMLFLRSVGNQAEKLRHYIHPKVIGKKWKPSTTHGYQNGISWALELGNQKGVCPIVVEDLDHPGHMLVEMICEEDGLFLEIADVIRHLELTILKGVRENRSNRVWAHFIVEASTGFQRMDIFWPLMQLLQRKGNSIPSNL